MSGDGWSCFAQLPSGLIDPKLSSLTLNWLRPRPTHAGFKLARREVDDERYARNMRIQRQALLAVPVLLVAIGAGAAADTLLELHLLADPRILFVAIWAGVAAISAAALLIVLTAFAIIRFRQAEPRRNAFRAALAEFAQIDAWRAERCEPAFWSAGLDAEGFEREAAELLAGHFGTGQVMLTRPLNDYGVDVLLCAPQGRIVAQCKPWDAQVGAVQVRALAGSKAFFAADRAVLVTLAAPSEDGEQAREIAAALAIELWDVTRIAAVATQIRAAN